MRAAAFLVAGCLLVTELAAQETDHEMTAPPEGARYEVVQNGNTAQYTFRLDRFTGEISRIRRSLTGAAWWENMEVVDPPVVQQGAERPRFQIFTSGIGPFNTFLIDTDTGAGWVLIGPDVVTGNAPEDGAVERWTPFEARE